MKSIQTIFMDLDNTLYDHKSETVPDKHIQALRLLKKKGYQICICTGRPPLLVKDLSLEDLIDWDGYVCGNGCYVYDRNKEPLFEKTIAPHLAQTIFDYAEKEDLGVLAFGNVKMATRQDPRVQEMIESFHFTGIDFRPLQDSDRFSNILFKPEDPKKPIPFLDALNGIEAIYMDQWVEIKRQGGSKFEGIQILMKQFGLPSTQYLAFGDSPIDQEMLKNAEIGVVMENGDPLLKTIPGIHQAPSCHEGGIYTWLKENGWIE